MSLDNDGRKTCFHGNGCQLCVRVCVCVHECMHVCVCVCVRACVIERINPELCRAKHLKRSICTSSLLPTNPAKGGSPTVETTMKKLVSDMRDQLLQGLAIMQRQSGIAKR